MRILAWVKDHIGFFDSSKTEFSAEKNTVGVYSQSISFKGLFFLLLVVGQAYLANSQHFGNPSPHRYAGDNNELSSPDFQLCNSGLAQSCFKLGKRYLDSGNRSYLPSFFSPSMSKAIDYFQKAVNKEPGNAKFLLAYGAALLMTNDHSTAELQFIAAQMIDASVKPLVAAVKQRRISPKDLIDLISDEISGNHHYEFPGKLY